MTTGIVLACSFGLCFLLSFTTIGRNPDDSGLARDRRLDDDRLERAMGAALPERRRTSASLVTCPGLGISDVSMIFYCPANAA